jgi:ATP-dependent Clp protease ATP-binding subunit ClpA
MRLLRLLRLGAPRVAKVQARLRGLPADQQELRRSMTMNGYNFTERVRKVLSLSREEAARLHHEYVGTEHVLLGVLREGEGVAATVLQNVGIDMDALSARLDETVKRGNSANVTGPDLPYTSRAKKVLELAMSEARDLNHSYVGTEHLLLGLLREEKGIAAQVLVDAGLTLDVARNEVLTILGTEVDRYSASRLPDRSGMVGWLGGAPTEQYPERVRVVLFEARALADRLGAESIEAVHVAIALLRHGDGVANVALERMGATPAEIIAALEALAPPVTRAEKPEATIDRSPQLQRAMAAASEEQRNSRARVLSTHHLLIGLLESDSGVAAAFAAQGATAERLRIESRRVVG